ncbi:MAG: ABC transporter permease, partial [Bacilli bacterium]
MRNFWGIVPRYIVKNKKRVIFMGIGIILSISLIVSLSIMVEALKKSSYKKMIDDAGGIYDVSFETRNYIRLEELKEDKLLEDIAIITTLGVHKIPNSEAGVEIGGYEEDIVNLLNFQLLEGRYPKGENEIALEHWILDAMPEKYNIGDSITLPYTIETFNAKGIKVQKEIESNFILVGLFDHVNNTSKNKNLAKAYVTKEFADKAL